MAQENLSGYAPKPLYERAYKANLPHCRCGSSSLDFQYEGTRIEGAGKSEKLTDVSVAKLNGSGKLVIEITQLDGTAYGCKASTHGYIYNPELEAKYKEVSELSCMAAKGKDIESSVYGVEGWFQEYCKKVCSHFLNSKSLAKK